MGTSNRRVIVVLFLIWALVLSTAPAAFAAERAIQIRWTDAAQLVRGKQVIVRTVTGARVKGRVRGVENDALVFEKDRTPPVPRASISEIRMIEYAGNGRFIGKLAGGVIGITFGLIGAAVIGMREGSTSPTGDKVAVVALPVGGLAGGLAGGWALGRLADKEVTVIRLIA